MVSKVQSHIPPTMIEYWRCMWNRFRLSPCGQGDPKGAQVAKTVIGVKQNEGPKGSARGTWGDPKGCPRGGLSARLAHPTKAWPMVALPPCSQ